jgi:hypothetical protein
MFVLHFPKPFSKIMTIEKLCYLKNTVRKFINSPPKPILSEITSIKPNLKRNNHNILLAFRGHLGDVLKST